MKCSIWGNSTTGGQSTADVEAGSLTLYQSIFSLSAKQYSRPHSEALNTNQQSQSRGHL